MSCTHRFFYRENGNQREIECIGSKKATPGLSTFDKEPEKIRSYLQPLFTHAADNIPSEFQSETLIYLQATAGMRLIPEVCHNIHDNSPYYTPTLVKSQAAQLTILVFFKLGDPGDDL